MIISTPPLELAIKLQNRKDRRFRNLHEIPGSSRNGVVRFLNFDNGRERRRIQAHAQGHTGVAISPDGRVLATQGPHWQGETIRLWNTARIREINPAARDAEDAAKAD